MDCDIAIRILKSSSALIWLSYTAGKFGELWFSDSWVYEDGRCSLHPVVYFFKIVLNLSDKSSQDSPDRFTRFSPYGRYLIVDDWFDPRFPIAQGMLPWQPILWQNRPTLTIICRPFIPKRIAMSLFWFKRLSVMIWYIMCKFGGWTPELTKIKSVHPVVSFFVISISHKLSQDSPDRFSQNFHRGRYLIVYITELILFFRSLKGRCHGNQF